MDEDIRGGGNLVIACQPNHIAAAAVADHEVARHGFHATGLIQHQRAGVHSGRADIGIGGRAGEDVRASACLGEVPWAADRTAQFKGTARIHINGAVAGVGDRSGPGTDPIARGQSPKEGLPAQPGPFKTSGLLPMVRLPATWRVPPLLTVAGVVMLPKADEFQKVSMPASTVTGPVKVFARTTPPHRRPSW